MHGPRVARLVHAAASGSGLGVGRGGGLFRVDIVREPEAEVDGVVALAVGRRARDGETWGCARGGERTVRCREKSESDDGRVSSSSKTNLSVADARERARESRRLHRRVARTRPFGALEYDVHARARGVARRRGISPARDERIEKRYFCREQRRGRKKRKRVSRKDGFPTHRACRLSCTRP